MRRGPGRCYDQPDVTHAPSATDLPSALERLELLDRELCACARAYHTLDPERERPTGLRQIAEQLIPPAHDARLAVAFCSTLEGIATSQRENFPENLFWDFDYVAASAWHAAHGQDDGVLRLRTIEQLFLRLQRMFGCNSPIRFRYVHDFIYGLDWERWVERDPSRHDGIGPFDRLFLVRVLSRGRDLVRRIERGGDATFPVLRDGEWRNPFAFSRAPEHELLLHRDLARRAEIPVQCWRVDAEPDWRKPYTRIRLQRARELGIPGRYDV